MSLRLATSFVNTNVPGAYVQTLVQSTPVGLGPTGNILIMGEADGGADFTNDTLSTNYFTPDQAQQVQQKYLSGPVVDAMRALSAPSNDTDITGAPSRIYILKTNQGDQASAPVDANYGTFTDQNYGINGNKYSFKILSLQSEMGPSLTSGTIAALGPSTPLPEIFTVTFPAGSVFAASGPGQYLTFQAGNYGTEYYAWFNVSSGNTDPAPAGMTGLQVPITAGNTATQVASAFATAMAALSAAFSVSPSGATCQVTAAANGDVNDPSVANMPAGSSVVINQYGTLTAASALNGLSFSIRNNGGASSTITLGSSSHLHDTATKLAAEIAGQLPSGLTCVEAGAQSITIESQPDSNAYRNGWGKDFELIDSTMGDLATLSLAAGLTTSSAEPEVEVNIVRPDINANEADDATAQVALSVGYQGTTATLTISAGMLTTTVTGGSGANLSINLKNVVTIGTLAALISSSAGYTAVADPNSSQLPPSALDTQSALPICSTGAGLAPGRIKRAAYNFQTAMGQSRYLSFAPTATHGLPNPSSSYAFLTGGERGATSALDIVDALSDAEGVVVNFVNPLFSQDASADIEAGVTDPGSTYTIAAIQAATLTHVLKMSTVQMKKNRLAMLSQAGTYQQAKTAAGTLASARATLCMQSCNQVNSVGVVTTYQPWYAAVIAAGMQSAGFYKAIVKKFANIISFVDPSGFDSGNPGDVSDALDAGILFLEAPAAGNRWVSDQTTYGFDTNFVYNSLQANYASDVISLDFASSLESAFVGKSLADVDAATVASFVADKMDGYKKLKLIASSDDAPLGYKNLSIQINGPILTVKVEIKLATAIYFIPITIEISQVQQAA